MQELGQYLRILQKNGKELNNVGEKMKSVLSQLNFLSKPKLKDIPSGSFITFFTIRSKTFIKQIIYDKEYSLF